MVGLKNEQDTRILRRLHRNFYADDEFVHGITLLQRLCIWNFKNDYANFPRRRNVNGRVRRTMKAIIITAIFIPTISLANP